MDKPNQNIAISLLVGLLLTASCAVAPTNDPPKGVHSAVYAIRDVTLVDVERGVAVPHQTVRIMGDRIRAIAPSARAEAEKGEMVIDGKGLYLIPGLVDAHVHYFQASRVERGTFGTLFVANGVTFVRDMGGETDLSLAFRDKNPGTGPPAPEMIVTGSILRGVSAPSRSTTICETSQDGRVAVQSLAEKGVDQIKVYGGLSKEAYLAIVDEARALGLKVVGHVPKAVGLSGVLEAGQASLEHIHDVLYALIRDADLAAIARLVSIIRDSGTAICPTLLVMNRRSNPKDPALQNDPALKFVPFTVKSSWDARTYPDSSHLKSLLPLFKVVVRALHEAGVTIVCGSDLVNPYVVAGFSLHEEMELLQEAGLSPASVLRAATIDAARLCDVDQRLGTVSVGKNASLVLLSKNPLEDVRHTREIAGVFLRGKYYDARRLGELLNSVGLVVKLTYPWEWSKEQLSAPGRLYAKGRYKFKMFDLEAGVEDFVISQTVDAYHLTVRQQYKAGIFPTIVTTAQFGLDFSFRSCEVRSHGEQPHAASYALEGEILTATVERKIWGNERESLYRSSQRLYESSTDTLLFPQIDAARLEVGQAKTFQMFFLGAAHWDARTHSAILHRDEDTEVVLSGGDAVTARHYTLEQNEAEEPMKREIWTNGKGVVLRMKTYVGGRTMEFRLESLELRVE